MPSWLIRLQSKSLAHPPPHKRPCLKSDGCLPKTPSGPPTRSVGRQPRPDIVHSSLYLPEAVHEALREAAFKERCKIHDIIMQGIDAALRKRGYPPVEDLKANTKR
jgi:hypothetical protein